MLNPAQDNPVLDASAREVEAPFQPADYQDGAARIAVNTDACTTNDNYMQKLGFAGADDLLNGDDPNDLVPNGLVPNDNWTNRDERPENPAKTEKDDQQNENPSEDKWDSVGGTNWDGVEETLEDGTIVGEYTNADGDKLTVLRNPDGSTRRILRKQDGSRTDELKRADGSSTTVITFPDGYRARIETDAQGNDFRIERFNPNNGRGEHIEILPDGTARVTELRAA